MQKVAIEAQLPFVNLYEQTRYLMAEKTGPNLTTNGITLNQFGYWAVSHEFYKQLADKPLQPWSLNIDAKSKTGEVKGVAISKISAKNNSLLFTVTEKTPPSLPSPTDSELPPQLAAQRDTLTVTNLTPGNYTLVIDGVQVATAKHTDWANGVPIDSSPAHREAEALRATINDKNLQFTYSWKALNQVHIVGERKTSPSGRALPAEVIAFDKLAKEREALISKKGPTLRKRQWQLSPTK